MPRHGGANGARKSPQRRGLCKSIGYSVCCVVAVVALPVAVYIGPNMVHSGALRELPEVGVARCAGGLSAECYACEDVQAIPDTALLVAGSDHRGWMQPGPGKGSRATRVGAAARGSLVLIDAASGRSRQLDVPEGVGDLHPHGLYVTPRLPTTRGAASSAATHRLLVVNHKGEDDAVEIFDVVAAAAAAAPGEQFDALRLTWRRSVTSPRAFASLNDVVATSDGSVMYASNWLRNDPWEPLAQVEMLAALPWGSVAGCSVDDLLGGASGDEACRVVADGLRMPNGLVLSVDERRLWVAETLEHALVAFGRDEGAIALSPTPRARVNTLPACDNLDLDRGTGDVYAACHPNLLRFLLHTALPSKYGAPSEVLRLRGLGLPDADATVRVDHVLLDPHGVAVNASSTAALDGSGRVWLGNLQDSKVNACDASA